MVTATKRVVVRNPQGFHARPADLFVKTASQFTAHVEVNKSGEVVDGKSILSILTLAAVQGTELVIQAEGPDAETAVDALADLFEQEFIDDSTSSSTSEHQRDRGSV
ncbi:MAG: HPr family phosphocarrier protein [Planctomycetaceae bacterium]|jgi:phosphotransferase system HPr (HPr) family protein|nr:HPr family phosphocarrier protein [Planctomycetaceae bacterium]MEC9003659.1 HPr family phosphocarrier protein [Planctomycetota bacterium]